MLQHQQELNTFLLEVSGALADEPFGQEALISKVMLQAKALVAAERVTFFVMDEEKHELYASLFDDGQVRPGGGGISIFPQAKLRIGNGSHWIEKHETARIFTLAS